MANEVKLRLELFDVYGKPLQEEVDVMLRNTVLLSERFRVRRPASTRIDITGLRGAPQGSYRVEIDPPSYQFVSLFINMKASGITPLSLTFPIDPDKVVGVNFPDYDDLSEDLRRLLENSPKVLSFDGKSGSELYESLDEIRKAGLLNLAVKMNATRLSNGRTVLSYVQELKEVRGDRLFAVVPKELHEEAGHSTDERIFRAVESSQHHPPPGFTRAGSFKTFDRYGNLQLTFFVKGNDYIADFDIDDASGLVHIFQVLFSKLSGKPSHPFTIHEILIAHQSLDPGYTFNLFHS